MKNAIQSQPLAAGQAASLPVSLNLQGRNVHTGDGKNGNWGERNVACACNHDGDNTALMGEMVRRYNSFPGLVAALSNLLADAEAMGIKDSSFSGSAIEARKILFNAQA